ncbi:HAMP domain-containing protein [Pseudoalteromonas sp. JBTF-M23]|uniref:histidine kinase n=1 Tax=Pseudoalteromonas caenipelagi TaxID=2726988 RepID=A0A849VDZ6_9GAMM|nr:ATP-binding protein [Pseudoalteromonas caenipelagi]NOU51612.1 HAMP domain-containing protein [Pseudoalteromonas caenipelagi]
MSFWRNDAIQSKQSYWSKFKPSGLFLQAFLAFWLTIISILVLLVALSQLQPEQLETKPLRGKLLDSMGHLTHNIERLVNKKKKPVEKVILHPRFNQHKWLYLAHENIEQSISSEVNSQNIDLSLLHFQTSNNPLFIATERYFAYGPFPIQLGNEQYQLYQIKPIRENALLMRVKMLPFWLKALAVLLPSILLSVLFSRRLVAPLNSLGSSAKALASGQLDARVNIPMRRNDEITTLMHDFNHMADKLEQSVMTHKQLLADVSHELRSPLTRLTLANALAQENASEQQLTYLTRIEKEAQCLDKMLADILTLSRLEHGQNSLHMHQVSFATLLDNVLLDAQFEAEQMGKNLTLAAPPTLTLMCNGELLSSAIENVLRNAIKYAKNNVELSFSLSQKAVEISICDDGEGVSDNALAQLCQPFFRTSQSRNRDSGGIGLGLAIAKRAIFAHHGSLEFQHNKPQGLMVKITLPI